ncbi:Hsp20/alpha crystallin family protein [Natrarchaeobius halalkaliphilus]|uniref:Hsp20/alpha crystallin family protein n=1 Tax=Natrarchaeobius halalkaliphilus TaxID=1679091 RepID=A0A3N6LMY1_9EURY|nr:Hsp20/alpha crystallin family protein [Natrarchaeobius halalkaliphilus]RQG89277.1 Hsp20/alpha crystallin family protein [Natrarchaeobius halalkaliphilus]
MPALRDALRDLSEDVFFDLLESDETYLIVLDVPGVTADSLDLSVEADRLCIEARRAKDLPGEYRYLEENRPMFLDAELPLPDDAIGGETTASVDRGVLELTIPKRPGGGETTIDVVDRSGSRTGSDADDRDDSEDNREPTESR